VTVPDIVTGVVENEERRMNKDIRKVLVTGSSGMIGTALCEALLDYGYEVTGVDLKRNKWSEVVDSATIICDLRNSTSFEKLTKDFDIVVHLAANARVFNTVVTPQLAKDNFDISFNVLEFCRLHNIKRFIFGSSREVYGNSDKVYSSENEVALMKCESPYTATKIGGETMVSAYHYCYGIEFIVLRFSNVYGKYDDSDRLIPLIIEQMRKDEDIIIFGREKLLDFTYISDCIQGIIKSIEKFNSVQGNIFNIATGKSITLLNLAGKMLSKAGATSKLLIQEKRTGEVIQFIADISRARELLQYEPEVFIDDGIVRTLEWYKNTNIFKDE
jgi:nucleoside-diphosphate-sugar epimerase